MKLRELLNPKKNSEELPPSKLLSVPDESGQLIAAKIYSHILQDVVWLALDPTFTGDGDGIPVYSIEEIRMMRGADEHTMSLLHVIKMIGSQLVTANDI